MPGGRIPERVAHEQSGAKAIYHGGAGLLALISLGNLANLSFLSSAIPGPEAFVAGRPLLLVTVIFVQIVVTLVLVGVLARRKTTVSGATRGVSRHVAPGMASSQS